MKHEWKTHEKNLYLPKTAPELVTVPPFRFFTLEGEGNPNEAAFATAVGLLYSLAYTVKMLPKKKAEPAGYFEYAVYPLEGVWDLTDKAKKAGVFSKDELKYKLMIRQPDFVTDELAESVIAKVKEKNPDALLAELKFETIEEGLCVQMLHLGPYDNEPESFALMKTFCQSNYLIRDDLRHREIYLSDARKTSPDKQKTVLRFKVRSGEVKS